MTRHSDKVDFHWRRPISNVTHIFLLLLFSSFRLNCIAIVNLCHMRPGKINCLQISFHSQKQSLLFVYLFLSPSKFEICTLIFHDDHNKHVGPYGIHACFHCFVAFFSHVTVHSDGLITSIQEVNLVNICNRFAMGFSLKCINKTYAKKEME